MKAKPDSRMSPPLPSWLSTTSGLLTVAVHAQPGARRDAIVGEHGGRLKIALTTPPIEGRANQALIKFLAKRLGLPRSAIELISGETSREKRLRISGLSVAALLDSLVADEKKEQV